VSLAGPVTLHRGCVRGEAHVRGDSEDYVRSSCAPEGTLTFASRPFSLRRPHYIWRVQNHASRLHDRGPSASVRRLTPTRLLALTSVARPLRLYDYHRTAAACFYSSRLRADAQSETRDFRVVLTADTNVTALARSWFVDGYDVITDE